jgi:hypothetical protein
MPFHDVPLAALDPLIAKLQREHREAVISVQSIPGGEVRVFTRHIGDVEIRENES